MEIKKSRGLHMAAPSRMIKKTAAVVSKHQIPQDFVDSHEMSGK